MNKLILNLCFLSLLSGAIFGQNGTVKGLVQDEKTNEPLIGATVMILNSEKGVVTDIDGFQFTDFKK